MGPEEMFFWQAFHELSPGRTMTGFGAGPIPLTEIEAYCRLYSLDEDTSLELLRHIRAMDSYYVGKVNEDQKKKRGRDDNTTKAVQNNRQ